MPKPEQSNSQSNALKIIFVLLLFIGMALAFWLSPTNEFNKEDFIRKFKKIHKSIYKTFDQKNKNDVYDWLEKCFSGDELDKQVFQFLKVMKKLEEEGYENHIQKIEYLELNLESIEGNNVKLYVKWRVFGLVKHRLHEHNRLNTYEAIYQVNHTIMKIKQSEIINGERITYPKRWYDQPAPPNETREPIVEQVDTPL